MSIHDVTICDICGKHLSSPESIARHRGNKCHIVWLEKQVIDLRLQTDILRAAVDILAGRK